MASRWPDVDAVVVGASAGGVDALLELLPRWPAGGPVMLVVVHRARLPGAGTLAQVLSRDCAVPVTDAWDRQPLLPGTVVLAPTDYHLMVDPGPVAALSVDEPVLWSRPAIDPLFESAAQVFGRRLLALVLTGASADGAEGAQAVRRAGGEVWVQDPDEAVAATMPQAAIRRAGADRVLGLPAMAQALQEGMKRRM